MPERAEKLKEKLGDDARIIKVIPQEMQDLTKQLKLSLESASG